MSPRVCFQVPAGTLEETALHKRRLGLIIGLTVLDATAACLPADAEGRRDFGDFSRIAAGGGSDSVCSGAPEAIGGSASGAGEIRRR